MAYPKKITGSISKIMLKLRYVLLLGLSSKFDFKFDCIYFKPPSMVVCPLPLTVTLMFNAHNFLILSM